MQLIQNGLKTPDGTILISRSRHDFKSYKDKINGQTYCIDGGLDYTKYSTGGHDAEFLTLYDTDCIFEIQDSIVWGTRPNGGDVVYRFLKDLDDEHLKNIAKTQKPTIWILMSIFYILNKRGVLWK